MAGLREVTRENYTAELAVQRGRDRDELQQAIDAKSEAMVTAWDASGRPNDGSLFANFETDDAAEAKRRIRRSFTKINGERKSALPEAERDGYVALAPMWYKDSDPDTDGWIVVQYSARHVVAGEKPEDENGNAETPNTETPDSESHGRRGRHQEG